MEILFELIFSIVFEGSIEGMKSKKLPLWIRIICIVIVSFIVLFIVSIIAFLAIKMWQENNRLLSILFFLLDLVLIFGMTKKFIDIKNEKK